MDRPENRFSKTELHALFNDTSAKPEEAVYGKVNSLLQEKLKMLLDDLSRTRKRVGKMVTPSEVKKSIVRVDGVYFLGVPSLHGILTKSKDGDCCDRGGRDGDNIKKKNKEHVFLN